MTPKERAQRLIDERDHMTLATIGAEGKPWVSPVFFVPDDDYNLYWTSWKKARHSGNILSRPDIAIVIWETEPATDAVYISAHAVELNELDDVERGMELMLRRSQPERWQIKSAADVLGDGPWRIYRATPQTIEVRADGADGGKPIVTREDADFRHLGR